MSEEIVNGIDVSKCKLYDHGICTSETTTYLSCEQNPNCYFKQIKRLEEECKILHEAQEQGVEQEEELERLREENKRLQKILQELEELSLKTYDVADFQMYFDKLGGIKQ